MIRRGRGASISRGLADGDLRGRHEAGDLLGGVVAAAGEDGGEDGGQGVLRVLDEAVGAPGDVLVGADEDDAVLLDLALAQPVAVEVLVLEALADDDGLELDVQGAGDALGGVGPGLAVDAGEQGEAGAVAMSWWTAC